MGTVKLKLGSTLEFIEGKEDDIIRTVKELTACHKLGAYINSLLRYVWENPEKFSRTEIDPLRYGIHPKRNAFFKEVNYKVEESRQAIERLYSESVVLLAAAKAGATLGLIENTEDYILGVESVEQYVKSLKSSLGLHNISYIPSGSKTTEIESIAESASEILVKMMVAKGVDLRIQQLNNVGQIVTQATNASNTNITTTDKAVEKNNSAESEESADSGDGGQTDNAVDVADSDARALLDFLNQA